MRSGLAWPTRDIRVPDERALLTALFDAAVAAAAPALCVLPHLPPPPAGRTVVVGAGKAAAAMARAVEAESAYDIRETAEALMLSVGDVNRALAKSLVHAHSLTMG